MAMAPRRSIVFEIRLRKDGPFIVRYYILCFMLSYGAWLHNDNVSDARSTLPWTKDFGGLGLQIRPSTPDIPCVTSPTQLNSGYAILYSSHIHLLP